MNHVLQVFGNLMSKGEKRDKGERRLLREQREKIGSIDKGGEMNQVGGRELLEPTSRGSQVGSNHGKLC